LAYITVKKKTIQNIVSNTDKKIIQVSSLRMEFNRVLMCSVIYQLFQGESIDGTDGRCVF